MTHLAKRKIFEQKVLEKHKKPIKIIIFDKRGNGDFKEYYQTTANWKSSGHIRLTSYDAVIDALADYYRITETELDIAINEVRKRMSQKRFTKDDGYYANGYAFLLAKSTGMRVGELMSLLWSDIKNNYIWIHSQQLRQIGNTGNYIYAPWTKDDIKHTGKGRKFPLFNSVKNVLDEIKSVQNDLGIKSPYVLCHKNGEWLKKEGIGTRWEPTLLLVLSKMH